MSNFNAGDERFATMLPAIMMLIGAVLILACFVLYQAIAERGALLVNFGTQEQPLQQAQQVKIQLDALASATAKLAEQGDKGAKEIIDALKSQGITVRP